MRRFFLSVSVIAAFALSAASPAAAGSASSLVSKGNKSFARKKYDEALKFFEKASVKAPESPIIYFNIGDAYFKKGDYEKARDNFQRAAEKTKEITFEAMAWYNLGNCAFKQGERQKDSDLKKALGYYEESVKFYMTALKKDPNLKDAAYNLEVARLVIKDMLDRIKKQEEMMKKQQEKMKAVVDSLLSLIKREKDVLDSTKRLDDSRATETAKKKRSARIKAKQKEIIGGTRGVQAMIDSLFSGKKPPQVASATAHLDSSTVAQYNAVDELSRVKLKKASRDEKRGLEQMKKALDDLTKQQKGRQGQENKQNQQNQSGVSNGKQEQKKNQRQPKNNQRKKQQAKPLDEKAKEILKEEKENRKRRQRAMAGRYKPVDKDW